MQELEKLTLERLRNLCSRSEKCKKDVSEKLHQWKYEGDHEKILEILIDEGFLNEQRYAQSFVNDKFRFARWGKNKIVYLLKQKGIPADCIEKAMEKIQEEEYDEIAEKELLKKYKNIKSGNQYEKKKRLYLFAIQRGYENDLVMRLIHKLIGD